MTVLTFALLGASAIACTTLSAGTAKRHARSYASKYARTHSFDTYSRNPDCERRTRRRFHCEVEVTRYHDPRYNSVDCRIVLRVSLIGRRVQTRKTGMGCAQY